MERTQVCLIIKARGVNMDIVNDIRTALGFDGTIPAVVMDAERPNPHLVPSDADVGGIIIVGLPQMAAGFRELFPKTMIVVLTDAIPSPTITDIGYTTCPHQAALAIEESIRVGRLQKTDILSAEGMATARQIENIAAVS